MTKEWQKEKYADKLSGKTFVVTCGREAYQLSFGVVERLTDLDSSQEEADTRTLLHAVHAARSKFFAVIIVSEDTESWYCAWPSRVLFRPPWSSNAVPRQE